MVPNSFQYSATSYSFLVPAGTYKIASDKETPLNGLLSVDMFGISVIYGRKITSDGFDHLTVTDVNPEPPKANAPIDVTDLGIVMDVKLLQE